MNIKMAPTRNVATSESTPSTMPETSAPPAVGRPLGRHALFTETFAHPKYKGSMNFLKKLKKNDLCDLARSYGIPTSLPPSAHPLPSSPPTSSSDSATQQLQGKVAMIHKITKKTMKVFDSMDDANKNRIFEPSSLDISDACNQGLLCKDHYWKMWDDVQNKAEFENMIDPSSGAANKTGFLMAVTHPILSDYCADRMGNIYSRKTELILNGYQCVDGYIKHEFVTCNGMKKCMLAHNFIFECFFAPKNNKTHDINHKNGVKNCNLLSNLELLNKKDHARATRAQHSTMGSKSGKSRSHPIKQILPTGEQVQHESINSAVRDVDGANRRSIINALKNGKKYLNSRWEYTHVQKNLENEIWKSLTGEFDGIEVSSKGRIRTATGTKGHKKTATYGYATISGYMSIFVKGHRLQVHTLICLAFHGPKPTPDHTVDHMDRDTTNNCIENLRWADKIEQSTNSTNVKGVSAYKKDGIFFKEWPSAAAAGKELGIDASSIRKCCKKKLFSAGKYKWKYTENTDVC
jgi:hypothetical protein